MTDILGRVKATFRKYSDFENTWKAAGLQRSEYFRLLRFPGGHLKPTTILFRGFLTHFASPYWFLHSVQEIFVDEVYKYSPSSSAPLIVDCGANIGLSVVYFKELAPNARIVAFEPDPDVFDLLAKNITGRSLTDVEILNRAVWTDDSMLTFEVEGALGGKVGRSEAVARKSIEVRGQRLRDLLDQEVDFLKLDIEGAEYSVLEDCRDKLENVRNLFVEFHGNTNEPQQLDEILAWVKTAGFRYYITEASKIQAHPFVSKGSPNDFDVQLNLSCYRPEKTGALR
jgi:FkbM family methyltransferase